MQFGPQHNVQGWGVYRTAPWHIHGVFSTKIQADSEAEKVGSQYNVAFGSTQAYSGDFKLEPVPGA
jgi:hypothetical protein